MAIVVGKKARVLVGASPAAIGHVVGSISYKVTDVLVDTTAYDSATKTFAPTGLKEAALSFTAQFDTADTAQDTLRTNAAIISTGTPALVPLLVYPEGTGTGLAKWTGDMAMESMEITSELEGVVEMAFSFKGAPMTEATQA